MPAYSAAGLACLRARHHHGLALIAWKRVQQAGKSAFERLNLLCSLLQRQSGFDHKPSQAYRLLFFHLGKTLSHVCTFYQAV